MDTSMTHLDAMILNGYRGPYDGCSHRNPTGMVVSTEITEWDERRDNYAYLSPSRSYAQSRINNVHDLLCEQDLSFVY